MPIEILHESMRRIAPEDRNEEHLGSGYGGQHGPAEGPVLKIHLNSPPHSASATCCATIAISASTSGISRAAAATLGT